MHEKRLRAEQHTERKMQRTGSQPRPFSNSERIGCFACKILRDREHRQNPQAWLRSRVERRKRAQMEWEADEDKAKKCKPAQQHWLTGECYATRNLWQGHSSRKYADALHNVADACKRKREDTGTEHGERVTKALHTAAVAATKVHQGVAISKLEWDYRYAALGGCLPDWAADGEQLHLTRSVTDVSVQGAKLA